MKSSRHAALPQAEWAAQQRADRADRLQRIESRLQRIESGRRDFLKRAAATVALGVFANSMPVPALWTLFTPRMPIDHRGEPRIVNVSFSARSGSPRLSITPVAQRRRADGGWEDVPNEREVYRV